MREVCSLIWLALVGAVRSRASLKAENTILRHQLNVLRRKSTKRADVRDAGPSDIRRLVSFGSGGAGRPGDREAEDRDQMAPRRVQIVLAVEVAGPWWPANCSA